jgi:outer membrane protein, heavy metal efflux system
MSFIKSVHVRFGVRLMLVILLFTTTFAQSDIGENITQINTAKPLITSVLPDYYNQNDGISLEQIIRSAFASNGDLKVAQIEIEKAKARLTQASLRQNPTLEVEQKSGNFVGSSGDNEFSVGVSVPLEIYNQRKRRIDLANAEITLKEAEIVARQRELASQIFIDYAESLASLRELEILEELLEIDTKIVVFVQIRVTEGETAPLELNLLQTEIERLRSKRELAIGRLQASITKLKFYAGIPYNESLKLRENIANAKLPPFPATIETSLAIAIKNRPEIRLTELEESLANAGLRLIRSNSKPELSAFSRYSSGKSIIDSPRGAFDQRDKSLTFGISIGLPIFNRNQGAKAEAEIAIRQAQERRSFAEKIIQNEVTTAFQRIEATRKAVSILQTAVLPRSRQNIETIRQVYEIGELKITDLLAEQKRLLEANRDLTDALTENYRAKAELLIALGITLEK